MDALPNAMSVYDDSKGGSLVKPAVKVKGCTGVKRPSAIAAVVQKIRDKRKGKK